LSWIDGEVVVGVNLGEWKRWAGRLKSETYALYLAYRDPRVPWYAKLFAALVVGYAFSPIDLIPDPIPILGYLDDLILIPIGVAFAVRMIPEDVLSESRQEAREMVKRGERPVSRAAAVVIVVLWLTLGMLGVLIMVRMVWG
jgi:uncharacterized membrane protein YkvA (DUF1232 family)